MATYNYPNRKQKVDRAIVNIKIPDNRNMKVNKMNMQITGTESVAIQDTSSKHTEQVEGTLSIHKLAVCISTVVERTMKHLHIEQCKNVQVQELDISGCVAYTYLPNKDIRVKRVVMDMYTLL